MYPTPDRAEAAVSRIMLPATCGELVQGTLDGVPCLVSCPIGLYVGAELTLKAEPGCGVPPESPKAASALCAGLSYLGRPRPGDRFGPGGRLDLLDGLPRGRGYGSSTTDVGATLYALGQAVGQFVGQFVGQPPGQPLGPAEVARLAVSVEPSDSTIFAGLALFDHCGGSFHTDLGSAPALAVVVIDPGGAVDTVAYNQADHRQALRRLAPLHREAFDLLRDGLKRGDHRAVGQAASMSARAHQAILPNPLLERTLELADEVGALGVCRAHSGTLLGILLDPADSAVAEVSSFIAKSLDNRAAVALYSLVDGGPRANTALGGLLWKPGCVTIPAWDH